MTKKRANTNKRTLEVKRTKPDEPVKPKNWEDLSDELKKMIVKEMNLVTRTKLKMCSKSDKKLVESVPMRFKKVEYVTKAKHPSYHWANVHFVADDLELEKDGQYFGIGRLHANDKWEAYALIQKVINSIIFSGNVEIDHLFIDAYYPGHPKHEFSSKSPIKVKEAKFGKDTDGWLQYWGEHFSTIDTVTFHKDLFSILDLPQFKTAKCLKIYDSCIDANSIYKDVDATTFKFDNCCTQASEIKEMVKKWIEEDRPIGSVIKFHGVKAYSEMVEHWFATQVMGPFTPITVDQIVEGMDDVEKNDDEESEIKCYICMNQGKYMTLAEADSTITISITDKKPF